MNIFKIIIRIYAPIPFYAYGNENANLFCEQTNNECNLSTTNKIKYNNKNVVPNEKRR